MLLEGRVGSKRGGAVAEVGLSKDGSSLVVAQATGKYTEAARAGGVYFGFYTLAAAPVIFGTEAGQSGVLWNPPDSGVDVAILLWSFAQRVAATTAGNLGIATYPGQDLQPTTATAATATGPALVGYGRSKAEFTGVGTVLGPESSFLPLAGIMTGAVTTTAVSTVVVDVGGAIILPPGTAAAVASCSTDPVAARGEIAVLWQELAR